MKMIDYSKWSDAQISQKVFFWVNGDILPNGGLAHISNDSFFYFGSNGLKKSFDPCNNPADAWPIILENRISIMQEIKCDCAAFGGFSMHHSGQADWDVCACDKNPLRAAMIVFLMMQEENNGG